MSDAKVEFGRHTDGSWEEAAPGQEQVFRFICPKRGHWCGGILIAGKTDVKRDGQNQNGGQAQWDWDGSRERPTFSPSVNCVGCWHGYIRAGRCVDTSSNDEPNPPSRR